MTKKKKKKSENLVQLFAIAKALRPTQGNETFFCDQLAFAFGK
jgi:hypothetical protein